MNLRHGELGRLVLRCRYLGDLRNLGMWNLKSLNLGNGELRSGNDFGLKRGQGKLGCLDLRGCGCYLGHLGSLMRLTLGHRCSRDWGELLPGRHSGVLDLRFWLSGGRERSRDGGGGQDRSRRGGQAGRRSLLDWLVH